MEGCLRRKVRRWYLPDVVIPGDIEDGRRGANAEDRLEALEICAVPGRLIVDVSRGSKTGGFKIPEVIFRSPIN